MSIGSYWLDNDEARKLIEGETWLSSGRVNNGSEYNGCRLFLRPLALESWLGPASEEVPIAKTGAPGRPSKGMPIVMDEFGRRRSNGETAASREAEARALADWFKDTYPTAPSRNNNIGTYLGGIFQETNFD